MVTVVGYKAGNLTSVLKALRFLGADVGVATHPETLATATCIVLPGVGHFAATARLDQSGMTQAIRHAIARGVPFLGICVGMQWLFAGSTEAPDQPGLGYFSQQVTRFPADHEKVPHVGWNQLEFAADSPLLQGVSSGEYAYFTHAWRAPVTDQTIATTRYIEPFAAACQHRLVCGVQFHPEKSSVVGLKILRNFLEMSTC